MSDLHDHPIIEMMEKTGTPNGKFEEEPVCPVCGRECDTFFKDYWGSIVGCDECIEKTEAYKLDD